MSTGGTYEVEIKSLLGTRERAQALAEKLKAKYPDIKMGTMHSQLNHYFIGGDLMKLANAVKTHLPPASFETLDDIAKKSQNHSVRTREADGRVLLVVKASVGADTSSNGVARIEFEAPVNLTLDELDNLLLSAGFAVQAKWSRERTEYTHADMHITIDRNAGYGYLAEFELIVADPGQIEEAKKQLYGVMAELGVSELSQERLERMFKFYNEHWGQYYGTDKVFTVE